MSDIYYGVSPSSDFFMHYGVKGMKWGVRRARESGNLRRLSKHHAKAYNKLVKLSEKADRGIQQKKLDEYNKRTKYAVLDGSIAGGVGTTLGFLSGVDKAAYKYGLPLSAALGIPKIQQVGALSGAAGIAAGALGSYAGKKIRQQIYKNRLNPVGHAKAVAKRDAWKREMDKAFKGTKYDGAMRLSKKTEKAVKKWMDSFEKHYQTGLSRGMSHEQAERYSNDYIAQHGFGNTHKRRR